MRRTQRLCATMVDVRGREVTVLRPSVVDESGWPQHTHTLSIAGGQRVTLTTRPGAACSPDVLPISSAALAARVAPGDLIHVSRYMFHGAARSGGSLYLRVDGMGAGGDIACTAEADAELDGLLTIFHAPRGGGGDGHPGAFGGGDEGAPLTAEDEAGLAALASEFEIDFLALAFCCSSADIAAARRALAVAGAPRAQVIAKVETRAAVVNFKDILSAADGVLISRGNLGIACEPEKARPTECP